MKPSACIPVLIITLPLVAMVLAVGRPRVTQDVRQAGAVLDKVALMTAEFNRKAYPDDQLLRCWAHREDCGAQTDDWIDWVRELRMQYRQAVEQILAGYPAGHYLSSVRRSLPRAERESDAALVTVSALYGSRRVQGRVPDYYTAREAVTAGFQTYRSIGAEPFDLYTVRLALRVNASVAGWVAAVRPPA